VELLVAVALLGVVLTLILEMLGQTQKIWKASRSTVSEFKDARVAFESITRRLSQSTLNAYWGWELENQVPKNLVRRSELHFISGPAKDLIGETSPGKGKRTGHAIFFQAPLGYTLEEADGKLVYGKLQNLLDGWGYFTEFGTDEFERPKFLNDLSNKPRPRPRYRLMEFRQPSENLQIYDLELGNTGTNAPTKNKDKLYSWFKGDSGKAYTVNWESNYKRDLSVDIVPANRILAENILALILMPCDTLEDPILKARLAPQYLYDSQLFRYKGTDARAVETRNQLPPLIEVTMIALDEADFNRYVRRNNITDAGGDPNFLQNSGATFTDAKQYDADLDKLKQYLSNERSDHHVQFKVFRATVRMREAKWSDSYSNGGPLGG
jgi:uncharacterized protein (TIGR02599 family)